MNTIFHDPHLDTLMKLKALAEKHGMFIRFGTSNSSNTDTNLDWILDYLTDDEKNTVNLLEEYYDDIIDGEMRKDNEAIWFELYDPRGNDRYGKYNVLAFSPEDVSFRLKDDWEESLEEIIDELQESSENSKNETTIQNIQKIIDFINENTQDCSKVVSFSKSLTYIRGFGNENEIVDGRVYRDGMALHFFTELVCDFLKEPMIHNVY